MFTPQGCKDIGVRQFEFVSKTCKTFSRLSNIFSKLKNGEKEFLPQTQIF